MSSLLAKSLFFGVVGGAAFGIAFGIIASFFRNGPPLTQAVAESWWWFAIVGCCIGLGQARAAWRDTSLAPAR